MTHRTIWSELPPAAKEALCIHAPEWILLALHRMACGHRCRVPKVGQMPTDIQRKQAALIYAELRASGCTYRKAMDTTAHRLGVSSRTVRRWIARSSN